MPIALTIQEKRIAKELAVIKKESGSHSPSPAMLAGVKGIIVKHDFCFLSNPYATDLFLRYWKRDFRNVRNLRKLVERYPSQNPALAEKLSRLAGVSARNIFVGNGATEVIQTVLHSLSNKKILVPIPTFSPYLEFAPKGVKTIPHELRREANFTLESEGFLKEVRQKKPDTVVIINPNNPDGGYMNTTTLRHLVEKLRHVETVIVDESFIHFADKDARAIRGAARLVQTFPNLVVIKSLSKDFGIAGLRLGYGVMSEARVSSLLKRGYLWNVSGFGEYFLDLLNSSMFLKEYEKARLRAVRERDDFFMALSNITGIKVYPSKANSFLIELLDGSKANDLMVRLLVTYSIYIRPCGDKVGLHGEFVRVASRTEAENKKLIQAFSDSLNQRY